MYLPLFKEDKPHFHTSGGQLAVGFMIYTYLSGTDTPVRVYSDPSGATPYTNPIVLDGRGEPSGQGIYADPSLSYKVVLKTPDDAVVWSMDGVKCAGVGDVIVEGITELEAGSPNVHVEMSPDGLSASISVDATSIEVDENLDPESANPVENRAVTNAMNGKQDKLTEMTDQEVEDLIGSLQ